MRQNLFLAYQYDGLHQKTHRELLMSLFKYHGIRLVDPTETEWCAVFLYSILKSNNLPVITTLYSRDYLEWGKSTKSPHAGDIVILKSEEVWYPLKGHIGFFTGRYMSTGNKPVLIELYGGNQDKRVCSKWYPMNRVLDYRTL